MIPNLTSSRPEPEAGSISDELMLAVYDMFLRNPEDTRGKPQVVWIVYFQCLIIYIDAIEPATPS